MVVSDTIKMSFGAVRNGLMGEDGEAMGGREASSTAVAKLQAGSEEDSRRPGRTREQVSWILDLVGPPGLAG